jgi:hypothetical protein
MAGGGVIDKYGWPETITDSAVRYLQLLNWYDNLILGLLMEGYQKLVEGSWRGAYPRTIVHAIGSMAAQGYMLRTAATDSLQHYDKPVIEPCQYDFELGGIRDFHVKLLQLVLLEIGLLLDVVAKVAETDRWLVPVMASALGARSRMAAVLNLMQGHAASVSPREAYLPAEFVYSYGQRYTSECPTRIEGWAEPLPALPVEETLYHTNGRLESVVIDHSQWQGEDRLWVAYMGSWGSVSYAAVDDAGLAHVPAGLWGHVWVSLTNRENVPVEDLYGASLAGPHLLWVG